MAVEVFTQSINLAKRRNTKWIIPGVALAGLGLFLFVRSWASRAAEQLSVKGIRARLKDTTFSSTRIEILLDLHNDTGVSVPVEGFQGYLLYGSTRLAPLEIKDPIVIQTGQQVTVVLNAHLQYTQLGLNILELIQSGQFLNRLYVEGILRTGGINVPVSKNILAIG